MFLWLWLRHACTGQCECVTYCCEFELLCWCLLSVWMYVWVCNQMAAGRNMHTPWEPQHHAATTTTKQTNKQEANTTLVEQNSAGFGKSPFPKAVFLQKLKYMECENNYIYISVYICLLRLKKMNLYFIQILFIVLLLHFKFYYMFIDFVTFL